jgi:hypothetical protein
MEEIGKHMANAGWDIGVVFMGQFGNALAMQKNWGAAF